MRLRLPTRLRDSSSFCTANVSFLVFLRRSQHAVERRLASLGVGRIQPNGMARRRARAAAGKSRCLAAQFRRALEPHGGGGFRGGWRSDTRGRPAFPGPSGSCVRRAVVAAHGDGEQNAWVLAENWGPSSARPGGRFSGKRAPCVLRGDGARPHGSRRAGPRADSEG